MKNLLLGLLIACAGCTRDDSICEITYTDGEVERIPCAYAWVDEPIFGKPMLLKISKGGVCVTRSLSMMKKWDLKCGSAKESGVEE